MFTSKGIGLFDTTFYFSLNLGARKEYLTLVKNGNQPPVEAAPVDAASPVSKAPRRTTIIFAC
jgi:hypothetical protein